MIWHIENNDEAKAIDQLAKDSDRAVAIVAATMVENSLTNAIKNHFYPDKDGYRDLFNPSGALGTFATKIDLAFAIGIYSAAARRDLVTMKNVRNAFAHRLDIVDFDSQNIRDLCANLKFCEGFINDSPSQAHVPEEKKRYVVLLAGRPVDKSDPPAPLKTGDYTSIKIGMPDLAERLGSARGRYITSAQVFTMLLHHLPPQGRALPKF